MENKLIVKHPNIPLRGYPEELLKIILYGTKDEAGVFTVWISNLLGLTGEVSAKRLFLALPAIEKHFISMSFQEITKVFEMYADGELKTKPRTNYFDRVLVGIIFNDYRDYKKVQPEKKTSEEKEKEYKESLDYIYAIQIFDFYLQNKELPIESYWLYDYLETKEILKYTKGAKSSAFKMAAKNSGTEENQIQQAKLLLLCDHFNKLIEIGSHLKNQL